MRYLVLLFLIGRVAYGQIVPGRYIVELDGDSIVDHTRKQRGGATSRRAAIRAEQREMRSRMGSSVAVDGSVETIGNALFVTVDDAEASRLSQLSGVRRVRPMRMVKRMLDRAVVVNRITEAWNQTGDDKAGEGIKIAIVDTGVDVSHPSLQNAAMSVPSTYPRTNTATDEVFTNDKVIVARSYVNLLARRDSDMSARDRVGHGTALAVVAAGLRTAAPLATIQGVAPRAYIGSYKVFGTPGVNDGATDAAILKAIDDAVADGMDIINLSLGSDIASRLEDDPLVAAVERASQAGVLVVCAAGNNGPDFGTISSPGTAPSAIAVGATPNDRTFGSSIEVEGLGPVLALRGSGEAPAEPVGGTLGDVALLDENGLACQTLPPGSLTGRVALILRGTCSFEVKLNNAERAGAVAAIVYATAAEPSPITMGVGAATLPAEMVSHQTGLLLKARGDGAAVSLRFTISAVPQEFNRVSTFSGIGPNVDVSVKPELVAVGGSFYVATQSFDPNGDMYSANGYALVSGTSFSAPLAAGALALLKSARPGLTVEQYRSLLINSSSSIGEAIQKMGAGQMNVSASLNARVAASPATLTLESNKMLRIDNLSVEPVVYAIQVEPLAGSAVPALSASALEVAPGQGGEVGLTLDGASLSPGSHEGFIRIVSGDTEIRVPYWFAARGGAPAAIPLLSQTASGRRNGQLRNAIYFRVTDAAGVPIPNAQPEIEATAGNGTLISITSLDADSPGLFAATVRLGPLAGVDTFRIKVGDASREVHITAQ
jgi:minor extracellular serine protease Vpr